MLMLLQFRGARAQAQTQSHHKQIGLWMMDDGSTIFPTARPMF
jgi:hypothetical protein